MIMKNNFKYLTALISISVLLFSAGSFAQESTISQTKLLEIENRVNNMPSFQLNDQKSKLLFEAESLEEEKENSQSPARLKSISLRLNEIFAELSMIESAIAVLGSVAIIGAITDDNARDITPPIINVIGPNPVTVERGTTYSDDGASADGGESVTTNFGNLNTNVAGTYNYI
jgi:hypothetical protein